MILASMAVLASLLTIADAPFGKFEVTVPEFAARDFSIADFGAKPDGTKCTNPSLRLISGALLTNIKGNIPTVKVMVKLISRAARALSLPFATETSMEKNMNRALTSSATPTYLDITFTFILRCY